VDHAAERQPGGRVRAAQQDQPDAGVLAAADDVLGEPHEPGQVDAGAHHVVAAAVEREQRRGGRQGERRVELGGGDGFDQPAADGEVGVVHGLAGRAGKPGRHEVGPAA
jgi:hypothetical protein